MPFHLAAAQYKHKAFTPLASLLLGYTYNCLAPALLDHLELSLPHSIFIHQSNHPSLNLSSLDSSSNFRGTAHKLIL